MTVPPQPAPGAMPPAAARLAAVYLGVVHYAAYRASHGDATARLIHAGCARAGHPRPLLSMVRPWLANCAAEVRLIRPVGDPYAASRLLADMRAAEAMVPGAAEAVWRDTVDSVRAGRLPAAAPGRRR